MISESQVLGISLDAVEREQQFADFVAEHCERARRLAWRLLGGDIAAAEDVTQEAFIKAYRALDRFRGDSSLATWFYRILVHQAHTYRRWRAVRDLWNQKLPETPPSTITENLSDPDLRRRIASALNSLSRRQREVFVLVHLEGFTVQECAELLQKPLGTVKSHLHRALLSLRKELADLYELTGETEK